jgi:uncharacterized repeat protein (TIGR01451 family)
MTQGNQKYIGKHVAIAALLTCAFASQALAQAPNACVKLENLAQTEKEVVDAKGVKTKVLETAGKVIPGTEVVYSIRASNVCQQNTDNVAINNAVPQHMVYVPNSANGAGSDITFSLDGKTFVPVAQLKVQENGVLRPARADEIRHIRWEFKSSLKPGASAVAQFRAVLE